MRPWYREMAMPTDLMGSGRPGEAVFVQVVPPSAPGEDGQPGVARPANAIGFSPGAGDRVGAGVGPWQPTGAAVVGLEGSAVSAQGRRVAPMGAIPMVATLPQGWPCSGGSVDLGGGGGSRNQGLLPARQRP